MNPRKFLPHVALHYRAFALLVGAVALLLLSTASRAQSWSGILSPSRAIDWSQVGIPGGIPTTRTQCGATIQASTYGNGSSDATSGIQSALNSCGANHYVLLGAGTFRINSHLSVPGNTTLRGSGADQTILDAHGSGGSVVALGSGQPNSAAATAITSGATAGSSSIVLANASGVTVGSYLLITELDDPTFVSSSGSEGACTWCDQFWNGTRDRGQIVEVTSVSGTSIGIAPGLYSTYSRTPQASTMTATKYAGVESLQVYANNTGMDQNFGMVACAYCWVSGVESNYADGDHVLVDWGYRDEVRDSYFSNAYHHAPGTHDSDVFIVDKTSATLVENNILERLHYSIILNWGAAGNVIAYNFMEGNVDADGGYPTMAGVNTHGAHPQFNLVEGNVAGQFYHDSVWGTSSHNTLFRNWALGISRWCTPLTGRSTVSCASSSSTTGWSNQANYAIQISYLATYYNFVGNVTGSAAEDVLGETKVNQIVYPGNRSYDSATYDWTFGYGELGDDGTGSGCSGGTAPCHNSSEYTTIFKHGDYSNADGSIDWSGSVTHTLPRSFYKASSSAPAWWRTGVAWPAIGPDVTGGTGPGGHVSSTTSANSAQDCFYNVMHGTDGGAGSPYVFNASVCYGQQTSSGPTPPSGLAATVN